MFVRYKLTTLGVHQAKANISPFERENCAVALRA